MFRCDSDGQRGCEVNNSNIGNYELSIFVTSELAELESRDVDQLYGCLQDNLVELGVDLTQGVCERLYSEIETQLKGGAK